MNGATTTGRPHRGGTNSVGVGGAAAAVTAVALWSTNALAATVALAGLSVMQVLLLQFATATVVLLAVRILGRRAPTSEQHAVRRFSRPWLAAMLVGIVGLAGTILLQYVAFDRAPIVEANIIAYGWPMLAAVVVAATARNRYTMLGLVFAATGFIGVGLILTAQDGGLTGTGQTVGYLAALASAACMAFYSLTIGRVRVPTIDVMIAATCFGAAVAGAATTAAGSPWPMSVSIPASIYIGIGPMAIGYWLWSRAMARTAARLAPLGYGTPLLSTLVLILAGEQFAGQAFFGGLLVLVCTIGVVVAEQRSRRSARPVTTATHP